MVKEVVNPVLSLQQLRSLLWHGFDPSTRNFHMLYALPKKKKDLQNSCCDSAVMNLTSIHEDAGSIIPGLAQWVKDPALLWLWPRLAIVAQIRPLAWELS